MLLLRLILRNQSLSFYGDLGQTQGHVHARQVFYHWVTPPAIHVPDSEDSLWACEGPTAMYLINGA